MTIHSPNPVAEIVTFTLAQGVTPDAFVALSQDSEAFVRAQPGFMVRRLSCGADGRWSDQVVWRDMTSAKAAAEAFPKQPFAAALMQAIEPGSIDMRHEDILWQMAA
ncbi:hypothetical protein PXK00_10695 [Phaeobacter sp. QD34_3]|uniref:hypothetical protein n=1 Tax=unclassified Phaeobacter TaxID=2621772 RepID=UPI00237F7FF4|nr:MULTISPECIES: hypothetical protein [unclassified Phaeobacter]MDE4133584.1 hypothetical protein [Phaeobacter sp. QD34_3]MDE4137220.1 hypothetical protein [Phaeobacter sp. QD34_24]MDE4174044.1 hypothetical protein [Phaeobacter sp. PT47_59]